MRGAWVVDRQKMYVKKGNDGNERARRCSRCHDSVVRAEHDGVVDAKAQGGMQPSYIIARVRRPVRLERIPGNDMIVTFREEQYATGN